MMILLLADNKMRSLNMRLAEVRLLFFSPSKVKDRKKALRSLLCLLVIFNEWTFFEGEEGEV